MAERTQQRQGTTAQWAAANPVLVPAEFGYDRVARNLKIGDGARSWSNLPSIPFSDTLPVNVMDPAFGIVGDGVADDTAGLNAAFAAAAGGRLDFPRGGNFVATGDITGMSNTTILGNGSTIDFRTMANGTALGQRIGIKFQGSIGSDLPISTAIAQWSRTVAGVSSTASLTAGDLVLLENDERPVPGMTRTDRDKGELAIVQSVDSSTQVTLTGGVLFAYGTTGLKLRKVTPAERVTIDGLSLKMRGVGSAHNGIQVRYGRDITVRNVQIDGAEDIAVGLNTV